MAQPGDVRKHCKGYIEVIARVDELGQPTGGYIVPPGNDDLVEDVVGYVKGEEEVGEYKMIFCPGCGVEYKMRIGVFTGFSCPCGWEAHVSIGMRKAGNPQAEMQAWKPKDDSER